MPLARHDSLEHQELLNLSKVNHSINNNNDNIYLYTIKIDHFRILTAGLDLA